MTVSRNDLPTDVAKAMSHPLRQRLLILYNEAPASPSDAAERLDEPLGKLRLHTRVEIPELGVAIGMLAALPGLDVGLQAESHRTQKLADARAIGAVALLDQLLGQVAHAATDHSSGDSGSPARDVLDKRLEIRQQLGVTLHLGDAARAGPAHTRGCRQIGIVEIPHARPDRLVVKPGRLMHGLDPAMPDRARLHAGPQPLQALIEKRRQRTKPRLDARLVHHDSGFHASDTTPPKTGRLFPAKPLGWSGCPTRSRYICTCCEPRT
jgi:hypothetical protein